MRGLMRSQISEAIEQWIMRAVANPELWAQASAAIQTQAKQRAGGWLLALISGAVKALEARVSELESADQ